MFYKIPRNTPAYVQLVNNIDGDLETQKILIYVDTYLNKLSLIEEYENNHGVIFMSFMIERNVNECEIDDYDCEDDFRDDIVNEIICVVKSSVEIVEAIEI